MSDLDQKFYTDTMISSTAALTRLGVLKGSIGLGMINQAACSRNSAPPTNATETDPTRNGALLSLDDFNISPNGSAVAFQFSHGAGTPSRLGTYEWQTGKITRILNPAGTWLSGASFSHDGKQLAAVLYVPSSPRAYRTIVTIDLTSMVITQATPPIFSPSYVVYPVFQPNTSRVLYCEDRYPYPTGLKLTAQSDSHADVVLSEANGFFRIYRPSFVGQSRIYFPAIGPSSQELRTMVSLGAEYNYQLQLGGSPKRLFPDLDDLRLFGSKYTSLSASYDGNIIIALGINLRVPQRRDGSRSYELFRITQAGQPIQLTELHGYLGYCRVSFDGSTVCFGSRASREAQTNLDIFDLKSHSLVRTDLRDRLLHDPKFMR